MIVYPLSKTERRLVRWGGLAMLAIAVTSLTVLGALALMTA
jgi:hypothetical protein